MKRDIIDTEDGTVLASVRKDPFELSPTRAGLDRGIREAFDGVESAPVMDTASPPKDPEGTAAEAWVDPDQDTILKRVDEVVRDQGWAIRERK